MVEQMAVLSSSGVRQVNKDLAAQSNYILPEETPTGEFWSAFVGMEVTRLKV
jgi:hypothetical protein